MTTHAYNLKLQAQGRIVVPTDVRTELGVQEGDELILVKEDFGYRMTSRRPRGISIRQPEESRG